MKIKEISVLLVSTGDWSLSRCIVRVQVDLAWLGLYLSSYRSPGLAIVQRPGRALGLAWASKCEALLHGTLPIFGIDVSCTCPLQHTLAWLGLGNTV